MVHVIIVTKTNVMVYIICNLIFPIYYYVYIKGCNPQRSQYYQLCGRILFATP